MHILCCYLVYTLISFSGLKKCIIKLTCKSFLTGTHDKKGFSIFAVLQTVVVWQLFVNSTLINNSCFLYKDKSPSDLFILFIYYFRQFNKTITVIIRIPNKQLQTECGIAQKGIKSRSKKAFTKKLKSDMKQINYIDDSIMQ